MAEKFEADSDGVLETTPEIFVETVKPDEIKRILDKALALQKGFKSASVEFTIGEPLPEKERIIAERKADFWGEVAKRLYKREKDEQQSLRARKQM